MGKFCAFLPDLLNFINLKMNKKFIGLSVFTLATAFAYAQESDTLKVNNLKEVVISDTKFAQSKEKAFLTPSQIDQEAENRLRQKIAAGIPSTYQEEKNILNQENAQIAQFKSLQSEYGTKAEQALERVFPGATEEHRALVKKKAEAYAEQGLSPADAERKIAIDAKVFTNQIARIGKSLPPSRL